MPPGSFSGYLALSLTVSCAFLGHVLSTCICAMLELPGPLLSILGDLLEEGPYILCLPGSRAGAPGRLLHDARYYFN